MPIFPVPTGQFAGMTQAQLLDARNAAQQALLTLAAGGKPQSVSYAQGDGSRNVTYTATSQDSVRMLIRQINAALGVSGRRAIAIRWR